MSTSRELLLPATQTGSFLGGAPLAIVPQRPGGSAEDEPPPRVLRAEDTGADKSGPVLHLQSLRLKLGALRGSRANAAVCCAPNTMETISQLLVLNEQV